MRPRPTVLLLILVLLATACGGLTFGREFPSPTAQMIRAGQTTKADLLRMFGEPNQVGLDTGDQTWAWTHASISEGKELTKQLTVRFDDRGLVRSYTFTSSFPEDMKRLK